ncbi:MAG: hypothetical protein RL097_545 [Candidatus Parcubacteria bacterium]|jgi:hypothetical protein
MVSVPIPYELGLDAGAKLLLLLVQFYKYTYRAT